MYITPMHSPHIKTNARTTDEHLVRKTLRGDDRYYAELMRRYMRSVYGFISERAPREHVERLTTETFYTFWKSVHTHPTEKKLRQKLFEIAAHTIREFYREERSLPAPSHSLIPSLLNQFKQNGRYSLKAARNFSLIEIADRIREPVRRSTMLPQIVKSDLTETYERLVPLIAKAQSIQQKLPAPGFFARLRGSRLKIIAPQS